MSNRSEGGKGLTWQSRVMKRSFDIAFSLLGLLLVGWVILLAAAIARIDTGLSGFFTQSRVGLHGREFQIIKIRTMRPVAGMTSNVTTASDPRITRLGRLLRRAKIDEFPQLFNVLRGDMSFVGPRPDVPGWADLLKGTDRIVLSVRPGITGPATLKYRNEEEVLAAEPDPERHNSEVIFPDKVLINKNYVTGYRFRDDIDCILCTLTGRHVISHKE